MSLKYEPASEPRHQLYHVRLRSGGTDVMILLLEGADLIRRYGVNIATVWLMNAAMWQVFFFFFFITLKLRVEWYTRL